MAQHNLAQRLLRKPINWLVETFFPMGIFYGDALNRQFANMTAYDGKASGETAVAGYLISKANEMGAEDIEIEVKNLTVRGVPSGSWRIRIEKFETEADS